MQTRRPHPIGEHLALLLQATMNPSKLSSKHLVLNWLSERGEYSKAAWSASLRKQDSTLRALSIFLFSDFPFLSLQFHDGDRFSSLLLGLKRMFLHQRMRSQKLSNPLAKCARPVPVNDPDTRFARKRGVIQEFVQAIGGFFHGHADHVDFVGSAGFPALLSHR